MSTIDIFRPIMSQEPQTTDWAAWSREAVETMIARNAEWPRQFGLEGSPAYRWSIKVTGTATIREVSLAQSFAELKGI